MVTFRMRLPPAASTTSPVSEYVPGGRHRQGSPGSVLHTLDGDAGAGGVDALRRATRRPGPAPARPPRAVPSCAGASGAMAKPHGAATAQRSDDLRPPRAAPTLEPPLETLGGAHSPHLPARPAPDAGTLCASSPSCGRAQPACSHGSPCKATCWPACPTPPRTLARVPDPSEHADPSAPRQRRSLRLVPTGTSGSACRQEGLRRSTGRRHRCGAGDDVVGVAGAQWRVVVSGRGL